MTSVAARYGLPSFGAKRPKSSVAGEPDSLPSERVLRAHIEELAEATGITVKIKDGSLTLGLNGGTPYAWPKAAGSAIRALCEVLYRRTETLRAIRQSALLAVNGVP